MEEIVNQILELLNRCSIQQREIIFQHLRKEFKIHPIESKLNIEAQIILETINKDEKGLTLRMIRGVIAEAAFGIEVVKKLTNWKNETPKGDLPFDFLLNDGNGSVSVQVKLQRSKDLIPMTANQALKKFSESLFVAETQKTRGGIDKSTNEDTRPYRFGEFDILAVCMQPSTGEWSTFYYTLSRWLLPREGDKSMMQKFQPVAMQPNEFWTNNFETCVEWLRTGVNKIIPS